jgi:hypothetical protein
VRRKLTADRKRISGWRGWPVGPAPLVAPPTGVWEVPLERDRGEHGFTRSLAVEDVLPALESIK